MSRSTSSSVCDTPPPRNSRVSSPVTSSNRNSASGRLARRSTTDTQRRYPNRARAERDSGQHERKAAERPHAEPLTEEDRPVRERDRRDQVRHERRIGSARLRDQREE